MGCRIGVIISCASMVSISCLMIARIFLAIVRLAFYLSDSFGRGPIGGLERSYLLKHQLDRRLSTEDGHVN